MTAGTVVGQYHGILSASLSPLDCIEWCHHRITILQPHSDPATLGILLHTSMYVATIVVKSYMFLKP